MKINLHTMVSLAAALAIGVPDARGVNIVDNSTGPIVDANEYCISILTPAPISALAAGGAAAMGHRATLLAQFPAIPPAQVVVGGAAPGTLTIDSYYAWVRGQVGGAHLTARYDDGDGVPDWLIPVPGSPSYRWVQEIDTNKPLGGAGVPYIDPRPGDDIKQGAAFELPYYWTDPEAIGRHTNGANFDLRFRDTPRRPCDQFVTWRADLFVTTENNFTYPQADATHVITIHDGARWGYDLIPTLAKLYDLIVFDTVIATTKVPLSWSAGIGETQQFGTQVVANLHPDGVSTNAPEVIEDSLHVQPELHFGLMTNYSFSVTIAEMGLLSVYVNDLDDPLSPLALSDELAFDLHIPVVELPGVMNMSMTINLDEDLLVIVDENQPVRTDTVLYVGDFSTFDPAAEGFTVLGARELYVASGIVSACIWDCQGTPDGLVNVPDFLSLLAQWGQVGTSCDYDGGGVSVTDFLAFLAHFGPCPAAPTGCLCPPDGIDEGEPCGADTNGGCNSEPPVFTQANCGETYCGTAWAEGGERDTDWYIIEDWHGGTISATLVSDFEGVCFIVGGIGPGGEPCDPIVLGDIGCASNCQNLQVASADVPPGPVAVFVAPGQCDGVGIHEGYPCDSGHNDYVLEINCGP